MYLSPHTIMLLIEHVIWKPGEVCNTFPPKDNHRWWCLFFGHSYCVSANRLYADWPKNPITTYKMIFMGKCVPSFQEPTYQWISVVWGLPLHAYMPSFPMTAFSQVDGMRRLYLRWRKLTRPLASHLQGWLSSVLEMPEVQLGDNLNRFFVWKKYELVIKSCILKRLLIILVILWFCLCQHILFLLLIYLVINFSLKLGAPVCCSEPSLCQREWTTGKPCVSADRD